MVLVEVFDTARLAASERFEAFAEAAAGRFARLRPRCAEDARSFEARILSCRLPRCSAHHIVATSCDAERTRSDAAQEGDDRAHLALMMRGRRTVRVGGAEWSAKPGQLFVAPAWRPFSLGGEGPDYAAVSIALPVPALRRDAVDRLARAQAAFHGAPLARPLRSALAALARALLGGRTAEVEAVCAAADWLFLAAVASKDGESARRGDAALARAALDEITLRGGEPDFALGMLAERLGASPRAVQRALAAQGDTFSGALRRARLQRAQRALAEGGRSIQQIAHDCGYEELSAFYRAFRRAFGAPPGALRARR